LRAFLYILYCEGHFIYPSSLHVVMDIKCRQQNTLRTFMEYYIVLWQIVFRTSKGKMICHHPQDQKPKFMHHGQNNFRVGGSIEVVVCNMGHTSLHVKDH